MKIQLLCLIPLRYEYFNKIFKYVQIIKEDQNTIHKSKRIACKMLNKNELY